MHDDEFYDRLNSALRLLTQQAGEPLPAPADIDEAREVLAKLEDDQATADDLEREAALDAVHRQLSMVTGLLGGSS